MEGREWHSKEKSGYADVCLPFHMKCLLPVQECENNIINTSLCSYSFPGFK